MPIDVQCTSCSTVLRAPDAAAGKKIKCPKCQAILAIPAGAGSIQAPAPTPAPAPPPMASAAPPPSRRRDEDDRPSRRDRDRDREDDDDDIVRRRGPRRDAHETEPTGTVPMVLGIISIVFAVMAIPLSFMSCCPPIAIISGGLAGLALLLGGGGVVAALIQKRGLPCPIIGLAISLVALAIILVWLLVVGKMVYDTNKTANKMIEEGQRIQEENRLRMEAEKRKREEEANKIINSPDFQDSKKKSQDNLKKIAKALLDYERQYGSLPYARYAGLNKEAQFPASGLSWRVAILPFIGRQDLYDEFKLNENWDSPANRKAGAKMPEVFLSPRQPGEKQRTYYKVFTGDGLFGKQNSPPQTKILARAPNAVFMVVEAGNLVEWWRPEDIDYNSAFPLPDLGGILPSRHFNAAMANGEVVFVSRNAYTDDQLKGLIPYNAGQAPPIWPPKQQ